MEIKNLLVTALVGLLIGGMVNAQQLQYVVGYESGSSSQLLLSDSTHVYYQGSLDISDSVRTYVFDPNTNSFDLMLVKKFFYDAQASCVKAEYYYNPNGGPSQWDTLYYGSDGIDSVVHYLSGGSVFRVKQYFYNNFKLIEKRELTYQPNNVIDTTRRLLYYDANTGFIKMEVRCNSMSNSSCVDTVYYFIGSDGKLDSLNANNGVRYVVNEYDPSYDIFSNNLFVETQLNCYVDPYDYATYFAYYKDIKSVSGYLGTIEKSVTDHQVLKSTSSERLEKSVFIQKSSGGDNIQEKHYYFTGSQLPLSAPVAKTSTWEVNSYFVDDYLHIESQESLKAVRVFTVGGKILLDKRLNGENRVSFRMSNLPKGMYYIKVVSAFGEVKFVPIVK